MIDFRSFEAFEGEKPDRLLNKHPDGTHVALQITIGDVYPAAIWSTETKRLVWSPEEAYGLSWLREGTQIAVLQYPFPGEDCRFVLYSWPQCHILQQCSLRIPGYLFDLIVSPTNDLAVCQWLDQCEFGFEFITLHDRSVVHLSQHGYFNGTTNFITRPVFQPEGYLWVCAYENNHDWWIDEDDLQYGKYSAKEGKREQLGALMVFHQAQLLGEIPLIATVPAGYRPPSLLAPGFFSQETKIPASSPEEWGHLSDSVPVFLDADHIMIRLPSGESQIHDLSPFWNESLSRQAE